MLVADVITFRICYSPNGWTDGELATQYIVHDFNAQTHDKVNGEAQVLLMDGHSSHHTPELLQFACKNNIIVLGYPPHCTHALQGLDVVCFAKMKEAWKEEITAHKKRSGWAVEKEDFAEVFGKAFQKAFTPETVKSAFRATGIYPYDPTVITEEQMRPSLATSMKANFPLTQSTLVHQVMAAFHYQPHKDVGELHTWFQFPMLDRIAGNDKVDTSLPSTPSQPDFRPVSAPTSTP